jgi:transcriptional regulator with XRE-family HTH domain
MASFDDEARVTPDGASIRRLRRSRGWSRRDFVDAIAEASFRESGRRATVTQNLLEGVEEVNERIPYATLCRIAAGLDCNPVELVLGGDVG